MPYKKGESGNPAGRPSGYNGLAKAIKEQTNNGEELLSFLLGVLRGKSKGGATTREQLYAAQMLLDRGWGKAPETVEIIGAAPTPVIDVSGWSTEQLQLAKALSDTISPMAPQPIPALKPQSLPRQIIDVESDE